MNRSFNAPSRGAALTLRQRLVSSSAATVPGPLVMTLSALLTGPLAALSVQAEEAAPAASGQSASEVKLDTLVVEEAASPPDANPYAHPAAPYQAQDVADVRRTRPIAETPQTMTVLTRDQIEESGKTELKDILAAQPGITLGTGEGGNSFGDRYIIRGYEARNDVYTDGLRDPGLITRETFALEQVEITKGPSSTFAGRGSTGGAVNSVTKKASTEDAFTTLNAGVGNYHYQRYTVDTNQTLSEKAAVRFNALYADADIPGREPAEEQRDGALLSGVLKASDAVNLSADYYRFRSDDRPDVGTYLVNGVPDPRVRNVSQDGLDFQETQADIGTVTVDVRVNADLRLQNKTRYGETANDYIITAYSARSGNLRHFSGWQENEYFGNQTNLILDTFLAGHRHTLVTGVELAREQTVAGNYTVNTNGTVSINPYEPNNSAWSGSFTRNDKRTDLTLGTLSLYVMDTVRFNADWELFAGLRYDQFDYDLFTAASTNRDGSLNPEKTYRFKDDFLNGHFGLVYSPWDKGNVYASWSTSSNINGGEADAASNCGYGGLCTDANGNYEAAKPEQATNLELGTKWQLMDDELLLTAAIFQTTKDDVIEGSTNSYQPSGSLNTGKNRVEGVELGLAGNLTDRLSGQVGVAVMNSETLESFDPDAVGKPKANFAEKSANAQLRFHASPQFAFGGVVTYASEIYGGQPDAGANTNVVLPGYTVFDLFGVYDFSDRLSLRGNVINAGDKRYYTAVYRGGSIVYIGDERSVSMTLSYRL